MTSEIKTWILELNVDSNDSDSSSFDLKYYSYHQFEKEETPSVIVLLDQDFDSSLLTDESHSDDKSAESIETNLNDVITVMDAVVDEFGPRKWILVGFDFGAIQYPLTIPMENSKQPTLPISLPQKHELRPDIQGLRAVAIGAVLVFHMWSTWFPLGFFVISGYLMFSILSRRRLNFATALDFYFRRFRRIVPLYLFLIVSVLIAAVLYVHPFDYAQLLNETFPSILYFSNCPAVHGSSYFDLRSNNLFFKHTWSLATELQFYAIVPLVFLMFQFLTGIHIFFTWIFILYIACLSFYRQSFVYTRLDSVHMAPDGRLWQFFAGFIAFLIRDSKLMVRFKSMEKSDSKLKFHIKQLVTQTLPSVLLVFFLFSTFGIDWPQAMKRVFTVMLTVWLLVLSSTQSSSFLTCVTLQKLGDFSYSLYLVHWPIYIMHRYLNPQDYDLDFVAGRDISWTIGCPLIVVSLVVGFVTEELTKRFLTRIRNWTALISTCFGLYFSLAVLIIYIGQHKMFAFDTRPMTKEWSDEVFQQVVLLHEQPDLRISHLESLNLNREITKFGINPMIGNATPVPTTFPVTYAPNVYVQKLVNIVIIGNSHAVCAVHGVQRYFKDVYANLTLYSALACMLMPMDKQIPDAKPFCLSYMNEVIAALRQWEHKIDIVMVFFGNNSLICHQCANDSNTFDVPIVFGFNFSTCGVMEKKRTRFVIPSIRTTISSISPTIITFLFTGVSFKLDIYGICIIKV
ncbi:hypothetical protein M3Y98_00858300 [Aphelenchoides besseyi]|nr:hypothetical protein M3Y98_00858300 [Aphelenchoides besseyi]KAI6211151.1 hypothetical protein M3Y96_00403300 [Aphelenchoides besseyi]